MTVAGRVLLLDADADFRRTARAQLVRHRLACDALADAREAERVLRRGVHDVLVIDVGPTANQRLILARQWIAGVVAVSARPSVGGLRAAFGARAVEYLVKPIGGTALAASVRAALDRARAFRGVRRVEGLIATWAEWVRLVDVVLDTPGRAALSAGLLDAIARAEAPSGEHRSGVRGADRLSPREQQVLLAFGSGLRVRQIARTLGVSVHTARAHVKAIMRKLDVHSQPALLERLRERDEPDHASWRSRPEDSQHAGR